jgi:hypothetical protein
VARKHNHGNSAPSRKCSCSFCRVCPFVYGIVCKPPAFLASRVKFSTIFAETHKLPNFEKSVHFVGLPVAPVAFAGVFVNNPCVPHSDLKKNQ